MMQWLLPGACITALLLFVNNPWIRFPAVVFVFAVSIWLCREYAELVHTPNYHGNPAFLEYQRESLLTKVKQCVKGKASGDTVTYPAGWIDEAPFSGLVDKGCLFERDLVLTSALWHTWLTGLYVRRPVGIWYPGGRLAESADKIEYRERIP